MAKFMVLSYLRHNGKKFFAGDSIELADEAAKVLVEGKVIAPVGSAKVEPKEELPVKEKKAK